MLIFGSFLGGSLQKMTNISWYIGLTAGVVGGISKFGKKSLSHPRVLHLVPDPPRVWEYGEANIRS